MKVIDVILSVIKSLFSTWITRFKENNPSGFRVVGLILLAITGLAGWIISNGIAVQYQPVIELVGYAAAGLAALFGINQLATGSREQVWAKLGDEAQANAAHTRTILLSILFVAGFVFAVWLITKNEKTFTPSPDTILSLQPGQDEPVDGFILGAIPFDPEADPAKPLVSYVVTLLASRLDTVSTIPTGGLPSFRIEDRKQYTFPLFPVTLSHVPTFSDFDGKILLKDGYKIERIVNIQIFNNR